MATEVYLNYKFQGEIKGAEEFVENIIAERRKGNISKELNIYYDKKTDRILLDTSKGRARRPLIIVRDGKSLVTDNHIKQLEKNEIKWSDLVQQGLVIDLKEFLFIGIMDILNIIFVNYVMFIGMLYIFLPWKMSKYGLLIPFYD